MRAGPGPRQVTRVRWCHGAADIVVLEPVVKELDNLEPSVHIQYDRETACEIEIHIHT